MAHRCDFCGDVLDEEEEETAEKLGKDVCDDCLHNGLDLLKRALHG
ncbi:MAG: hypothetical protein SVW77_01685 [Candidatus Nanohaloarchaea archaeon]|nr:hypothetical protein [Candidatus Nanohaloarchaea archaeon]